MNTIKFLQRGGTSNLSTLDEMIAQGPGFYTFIKLVDPTGVTGWGDAKEAVKRYNSNRTLGNAYDAVTEIAGAIPIISKAPKWFNALQGLVTGQGAVNDYKYGKDKEKQYGDEIVVDYWDNTVKPRREALKGHKFMRKYGVSANDTNRLPSFQLAPKGYKVGTVISNYTLPNKYAQQMVDKYRKNYLKYKEKGYFKRGGEMNILQSLKNGSGIHIKKKNRGKFTSYCGGKVTDSCIRRAKASGNPTLVKRATFAANARKWKHQKGGTLQSGIKVGSLLGDAMGKVIVQNNKKNDAFNWFKSRYQPINWNNMKYIYKQMKQAGIPYDTTIAVMGNIIHESQGDPRRRQMGGGPGYGLLQWNKGTEPGDTLELQTKGIINSIVNPSGQNNYWYHGGEGSGFNSGEAVRQYMNRKNNYEFTRKTKAFSDSLLRPGKPEMDDRVKSSRSLAAISDWFPEYLEGGKV